LGAAALRSLRVGYSPDKVRKTVPSSSFPDMGSPLPHHQGGAGQACAPSRILSTKGGLTSSPGRSRAGRTGSWPVRFRRSLARSSKGDRPDPVVRPFPLVPPGVKTGLRRAVQTQVEPRFL
jgi:hypothetical protein